MRSFTIILALLALLLPGCALNSVLPGVDLSFQAGLDGPTAQVGASAAINMPEAACGVLDAFGLADPNGEFCAGYFASRPIRFQEALERASEVQAEVGVSPEGNGQDALSRARTLRPAVLAARGPQ